MVGISNIVPGYKHIHMLNGYSLPKDKTTIYKYMPLHRFLQCVNDNAIIFVSPNTWYDPFEQLHYGIDCSSKGYKTEDIACLCVSEKSSANEDASWRVYSESTGKSVRISIEYKCLMDILEQYADEKGFDVYIGKVNYSFDKKDIERLHLPSSNHYHEYFPNVMNREHYLSLMLLKRKAFQYENEVRIFLVKEKIMFSNNLLKIDCDYRARGLVSNVMLSPYPPVRQDKDIAYKVRERINKLESDEIKKELNNLLGCKIQQSLLYKVYSCIERV